MSDKDGKPIAQGSGFLVSKDGVIVTNYQVISEGNSAIVKFPDGAFYAVDGVLASDKTRDVAVIKAHGENFHALTLGNSDQLQVGEEVVAIGNPLSLESTVSNGIVSGIRTVKEKGGKFLQVTTPISPGSSGGPPFNMAGAVVGITTLYIEGGENLNFAIPINDTKELVMLSLSTDSKVHDFPNENKSVQTQTPDAATASVQPQTPDTTLPDVATALRWISGHMSTITTTIPGANGTHIQGRDDTSLSFQGCRVTVYVTSFEFTVELGLAFGDQFMITWGPFDLSNLRPDEIGLTRDSFLQIGAVNAIPYSNESRVGTQKAMRSALRIQFSSDDLVKRQEDAWYAAIVGCGGKPTPDVF
jgi:hypothetical protein